MCRSGSRVLDGRPTLRIESSAVVSSPSFPKTVRLDLTLRVHPGVVASLREPGPHHHAQRGPRHRHAAADGLRRDGGGA